MFPIQIDGLTGNEGFVFFRSHPVSNQPKPHTLTFLRRLQLIHFLIVFIFTWVPPDLQQRWSLSSVCSDRRGGWGEWQHATFHPELMCQAYHTAERS